MFLPDWDILKFLDHFTYGVSTVCGKSLNWLLGAIEKAIEARKDSLRRKCPGAVNSNEPKLIWVKAINRISTTKHEPILAVHNKFSTILEDLLSNRRYHYIMDVSKEMQNG